MNTPKYHMENSFNPATAHPGEAHSIIMRHIPQGSNVLELGCASGYLSGYMETALGCRVTGLEYDQNAVEIAKTRMTEVYQADLDLPDALSVVKASAPYDVLLAAAILEHIKYPQQVLEEIRTLLQPDAWVIVSLPNVAYWKIRLNLLMGKFDYQDYGVMDKTHLKLYTRKTGQELLESSGYTVHDFQTSGSLIQNVINTLPRYKNNPANTPPQILPQLFGYELIYFARPSS